MLFHDYSPRSPLCNSPMSSDNSQCSLHDGIFRSLQPLHQRFPSVVPAYASIAQGTTHGVGLQGSGLARHHHQVPPSQILWAASSLAAPSSVSFVKLFLAFTAGGLFFSTAIAGMTACYAMGMDNVRRLLEIFGVIFQRVWITFTLGLGAAKLALLGEDEHSLALELEESQKRKWQWK